MSTVVEGFDHWGATGGRPTEYPWAAWLDGRTHKLSIEDMRSTTFRNFTSTAHYAAKRRGMEIRTKRWDYNRRYGVYLSLFIQAWKIGEAPVVFPASNPTNQEERI